MSNVCGGGGGVIWAFGEGIYGAHDRNVQAVCRCSGIKPVDTPLYYLVFKYKYRVIKKSLRTWWLQYIKLQVMFKLSPASLQTFIDTPNCVLEGRVQYSAVHIPNVLCDGQLQSDWNSLKYFCLFLYCNHQVHGDFTITLYLRQGDT
jgi:hypothetical protein